MTHAGLIRRFDDFQADARRLVVRKNADYANEDYALINFTRAAMIAATTEGQVCIVHIATKIARLQELLMGKHPQNESIRDTLLDLANYAFLMDCILND